MSRVVAGLSSPLREPLGLDAREVNYPDYRRAGLPITTAWMESLVKEMNYRAKGTEMFSNDPDGGEAILQVRAAELSDDDRLSRQIHARSGSPFTHRPKLPSFKRPPADKRRKG